MESLKRNLKKTPFYGAIKEMHRRLKKRPRHPLQDKPTTRVDLVRLGTEYGGWEFVDDGSLDGCTIISAGLGEDASFDIEFATKYRATVIIVDPTPRAIAHFEEISNRLGCKKECDYRRGGKQPVEAYDLSALSSGNLLLVERALWNTNTNLKFFQPANPQNVSHSIVNYQHGYSRSTSSIEVRAITLSNLLNELQLKPTDIPLIKLDIEGAEIEVLEQCISEGIKPRQILVEFDELHVPSTRGFERVSKINRLLEQNGYEMVRTDGTADFLYVRN